MTAYTNTRDNSILTGVGYKDGDTLTTVNGSKWVYQNESWFPVMFAGNPDVQPLTAQRNSSGGIAPVGDLSGWLTASGVRSRRITVSRANPTSSQGSLELPENAISVALHYRQGSGAASTGGAIKFVVGAGAKEEAAWRLAQAGKHSRMALGQRRVYMLDSLPVKRLDWQAAAAETGTSELVIDVDVLRPLKTGTDVVLAPMAQLSTDAAIYDESGYERHGAFDAALTAAAAAANPGYLTTGAATAGSQGASFPATIFDSVSPNTAGQYILRFTMDAPAAAAGGQMFCGTLDAGGSPPDGIKWTAWPDGRVACILKLSGTIDTWYDSFPGVLVSGVEHHYSVFVDRATGTFSAWIDNFPIIVQRDIAGKSIHTTGKLRIGNDTAGRSNAGKYRGLRLINAAGMAYDDAAQMVEIMNLMYS